MMRLATLLTLAVAAAASTEFLDPSPSLRGLVNSKYTTYSNVITNLTAANGTAAALKEAVSDKAHAVGGALHAATDPVGNLTLAKFHAIDAAEYQALVPGCDPALKKPQPGAYAFLGSGFLLPYYQGVVQGLQDRGVLTPEVMATAKFAGFSGGSLMAVLTALGWSGSRQFALFKDIVAGIGACKAAAVTPADMIACNLNQVGIPIVAAALAGTDVPSIINGRAEIFACQVNARASTLDNSISMATGSWSSNADVLANIMVSDQIACFTTDTFYNVFRGAPYIDGGYCTDYAQMCPKDLTKCLKISTEFLGPNLPPGTPFPTEQNCPGGLVVPPNFLPSVGKAYYTPGDRSTWTLPQGSCLSEADKKAVNTAPLHVAQGVTAKPDIHPAFYAPLPPVFADGCAWLAASLAPPPGQLLAGLQAEFDHGYASAAGWADAHGYCA